MYSKVSSRKRWFIVLLVFLMLFSMTAAFGKVRSIRTRTIGSDGVVHTIKTYARIDSSVLLNQPLLRVTVQNDADPTTLQVKLIIEISDVDRTGWNSDTSVTVSLGLEANERVIFDNTKISGNIEAYGFEGASVDSFGLDDFSSDFGDTDFDYMGIITPDTGSGEGLPEGKYSIYFEFYENDSLIETSEAATFTIVSIGSLAIDEYPAIANLEDPVLQWTIPEVPIYEDTKSHGYKTKSVVTIKGKGVNYKKEIIHDKAVRPGSSDLKGYPDDTYFTEGTVTLDLSSEDLAFRMGETYTYSVEFIDWNGLAIVESPPQINYTFPSYRPRYFTPSGGEEITELAPTFEWAFDEYEPWIDYYNFYLNGERIESNITDTSFTLDEPLDFGESFTWYVVPYYASDNTAFYDYESPPSTASFTTKDHAPPQVVMSSPEEDVQLMNEESYVFTADIETFDDADIDSVVWSIGSQELYGETVTFEPDDLLSGTLNVTCEVTDSEGSSASAETEIRILDPALAILDGSRNTTANQELEFQTDPRNTWDIDEILWTIYTPTGSEETFTGETVRYKFSDLGDFEIEAVGNTEDSFGNVREIVTPRYTVSVESAGPPQVVFQSPAAMGLLRAGNEVPFIAGISGPNEIVSTIWRVNGEETLFEGIKEEFRYTPEMDAVSGSSGILQVEVAAVDVFGDQAEVQSRDFRVIDPAVAITNMQEDASWPLNQSFEARLQAEYADSLSWFVNGQEQTGAYQFPDPDEYTLRAEAEWQIVGSSGSIESYTDMQEFSIQVIDSTPPQVAVTGPAAPSGTPYLTGVPYTFTGQILSDADIESMWWEIDGDGPIETDDGSATYNFEPGRGPGTVRAVFNAENTSGAVGRAERIITLVDPTVTILWPSETNFSTGSSVPVQAVPSAGELLWRLEGETAEGEMIDRIFSSAWDRQLDTAGQYTLQTGYLIEAVGGDGGAVEFTRFLEDELFAFSIYSQEPPQVTASLPEREVLRQVVNQPLSFVYEAESGNGDITVDWTVTDSSGSIEAEQTGTAFSYAWPETGIYTVRAQAADPMGLSSEQRWSVTVTDPEIAVTYPEAGKSYSTMGITAPVVDGRDIVSSAVYLDGSETPVSADFNWGSLSAGDHTIQAAGTYYIISDDSGSAERTVESPAVTFTVRELAPPTAEFIGIASGDTVLADVPYTAAVDAEGAEGRGIASVSWTLNGNAIGEGTEIEFTVPERGKHTLKAEVEDDAGMTKSLTAELTAVDPSLQITLPTLFGRTGTYPSDTPITMKYSGIDVENVIWILEGSSFTGNRFSFDPGTYSVNAEGTISVRDENGEYGEYLVQAEEEQTITVLGLTAAADITVDPVQSYAGSEIEAEVILDGEAEAVASLAWLLDGVTLETRTSLDSLTQTLTLPAAPAVGQHTLQVRVTDVFGRVSTRSTDFSVYQPMSISLDSPEAGSSFGPEETIPLKGSLSSGSDRTLVDRFFWSLDGNEIAGSDFLNGYLEAQEAGRHELTFTAEDMFGSSVSKEIEFFVQSDLLLSLQSPKQDTVLIEGGALTFRASAKTLSSRVDVSSLVDDITWFVNGDERANGLSFVFSGADPDTYTVQARYEVEDVSRQTREVTVTVEALERPAVTFPQFDSVIYYSRDDRLQFQAEGYEDASYTWSLDGTVIGRGQQFSYNPNGRTGAGRLELEMVYQGISQKTGGTLTLAVNTPPQLTLTVPAQQYTGKQLAFTADAIDVEDGILQPTVYFDGTQITADAEIVFEDKDLGTHEIRASVEDSQGAVQEKQASFTVKRGIEGVEIVSPRAESSFIVNKPLSLQAGIIGGDGAQDAGSYTWTIRYLDSVNGAGAPEELTGKKVMFTPEQIGTVKAEAVFVPSSGQQASYRKEVVFTVQPEPAVLSLYWPHGTIVNAGTVLAPEAVGLTAERAEGGTLEWYLDGQQIDAENLRAPNSGGEYTLAVRFVEEGKTTARDQITFTVNEQPSVSIVSPVHESLYEVNTPVILTAAVSDDQPFGGTVSWLDENGDVLGTGNPAVLQNLPEGRQVIRAAVEDQYGAANEGASPDTEPAENSDVITLTLYEPLKLESASVQNGIGTYLLTSGLPLEAEAAVVGGADPSVEWSLKQKSAETVISSASAAFAVDPELYTAGAATIRLTVRDRGAVRISRDFSVQFVENATLALVSPEAGAPVWASGELQVQLNYVGMTEPEITAFINEAPVTITGRETAGAQGSAVFTVDCSSCSSEGVYELLIEAQENGLTQSVSYTMNVFERETGIFIAEMPQSVDLLDTAADWTVRAETFGIDPSRIVWFTSQSEEAAAEGPLLNLAGAGLAKGNTTIAVQAFDASGNLLGEDSGHIRILTNLSLALEPQNELIAVRQGAETQLQAAAYDRDGTKLQGESIQWTSHIAGILGTGDVLRPGQIGMAPGEHIITAEAVGMDGTSKKLSTKVILREAEGGPPPETAEDQDEDEDEDEEERGSGRREYTRGRGIEVGTTVVSTVFSVSKNVQVIRDGTPSSVESDTEFLETDRIELKNNRAELVLLIGSTGDILTLSGKGDYIWDDDEAAWIED